MNKTIPIIKYISVLFTLLLLLTLPSQAATAPARVAVLPFTINAEKDLSFLKNGIVDMLASRLAWPDKVVVISREEMQKAGAPAAGPLTESEARSIGTRIGADYVLFGSLTVFGGSVSIDAKMTDLSGGRPTLSFFNQSRSMDEVIPRINQFAEEINAKVFGRTVALQALPQQAAPAPQPSIYAHPEKALAPELNQGGFVQEGSSPFVIERGAEGGGDFWKSQNIPDELKGIALADVDGDGKNETILLSSQKVSIYRAEAGRFFRLGEFSGERIQDFIALDAADINKDGRAEIFVTSLDTGSQRLDSFVLDWRQNKPVPSATGLNWYFRVLNHPARGPLLMGQGRGAASMFVGAVYELSWNGSTYIAEVPAQLPGATTVFGFARGDIMQNGGEEVLVLDKYDRLRLLSSAGEKEWVSKDRYGGSENFLEEWKTGSSSNTEATPNGVFLPQRILVLDLKRDGRIEVVVVKNEALTGRVFERYRRYGEAQFESLSWDSLGLSRNWHTRKITGYVSDYAVGDFDNDGRPDLVAALVSKRETPIGKARSSVIAYDLSPLLGKKQMEGKAEGK